MMRPTATPLDDALVALDAAVGRMAGAGRRSRQARAVRAAAAMVRCGAVALACEGGRMTPLDAVARVLDAATEAGVAWPDIIEAVNAAGERNAGPEIRR